MGWKLFSSLVGIAGAMTKFKLWKSIVGIVRFSAWSFGGVIIEHLFKESLPTKDPVITEVTKSRFGLGSLLFAVFLCTLLGVLCLTATGRRVGGKFRGRIRLHSRGFSLWVGKSDNEGGEKKGLWETVAEEVAKDEEEDRQRSARLALQQSRLPPLHPNTGKKAARVHIDSPIAQRPDHVKHKSSPDLSAGSNKIFR